VGGGGGGGAVGWGGSGGGGGGGLEGGEECVAGVGRLGLGPNGSVKTYSFRGGSSPFLNDRTRTALLTHSLESSVEKGEEGGGHKSAVLALGRGFLRYPLPVYWGEQATEEEGGRLPKVPTKNRESSGKRNWSVEGGDRPILEVLTPVSTPLLTSAG